MEQNKINIEVKKVNKESKKIEWTETIEIPYDVEVKKNTKNTTNDKQEKNLTSNSDSKDNNPLINTTVINMENNPFYQPSMNTLEFDRGDTMLIADVNNESSEEVTKEQKIAALEKLFKDKIIDTKEFESKRKLVLESK